MAISKYSSVTVLVDSKTDCSGLLPMDVIKKTQIAKWGYPKPLWAGRTAALQPSDQRGTVNSHIGWEVFGKVV